MAKVGRPLKFESLNELIELADAYFDNTPETEWTITGLALALDTTRETLMDYENKDEFSDTIKKYKLKVHNAYEKDLRRKGRSGDIFALKNFGWTDKSEVENTVNLPQPILGGTSVPANNSIDEDTKPNQAS
jgi:hypothetical protein